MDDTEKDNASSALEETDQDAEGQDDGAEEEEPSGESESSTEEEQDADGEGSEGKSRKAVPLSRFNKVYRRTKELERVVGFYRENIPDADELVAFKKWKTSQKESNGKDQKEKSAYSPEQISRARTVIETAYPEIKDLLSKTSKDEKTREEAQWDRALEAVNTTAKELDIPDDIIHIVGTSAMEHVGSNEKLLKRWQTGDTSVVPIAVKAIWEKMAKALKIKPRSKPAEDLSAGMKRRVASLPNMRDGGGMTSKGKDPLKGKGLDKSVHDAAWEIMQQTRNQD